MKQDYASDLVLLSQTITKLVDGVNEHEDTGPFGGATMQVQIDWIKREAEFALGLTEDIPLPSVKAQLQRILVVVNEGATGINPLYDWTRELTNRLSDDAENIKFVHVRSEVARYFDEPNLFGEQVTDRFPTVTHDVADAGKCLALGQGTATVFHLMRVMEIGLRALAAPLGIPYAPSWESYLKQINAKINEDHKNKSEEWKIGEPFYRDLAGDLLIVKTTWRNPTMHPKARYMPDEAEQIFSAVRAFMRRLATHFSEIAA